MSRKNQVSMAVHNSINDPFGTWQHQCAPTFIDGHKGNHIAAGQKEVASCGFPPSLLGIGDEAPIKLLLIWSKRVMSGYLQSWELADFLWFCVKPSANDKTHVASSNSVKWLLYFASIQHSLFANKLMYILIFQAGSPKGGWRGTSCGALCSLVLCWKALDER